MKTIVDTGDAGKGKSFAFREFPIVHSTETGFNYVVHGPCMENAPVTDADDVVCFMIDHVCKKEED